MKMVKVKQEIYSVLKDKTPFVWKEDSLMEILDEIEMVIVRELDNDLLEKTNR